MTMKSYLKAQGEELDRTLDTLMERAIDLALQEDLGMGEPIDITSDATIPRSCRASATVVLKEPGVIAGIDIFDRVMKRFASDVSIEQLVADGDTITTVPEELLRLEGPAHAILSGERLALNLLQRMSGVATMTVQFVKKAKPFNISILDTRKTTPCLRAFEKYAVASVGGVNHRMGLFDHILIKENHIRVAGSIKEAIAKTRSKYPEKSVEVETTNLAEVQEALDSKAEKILLDNMTPAMVRDCIKLIDRRSKIEVSGGIKASNIDQYLIEGVDYISIGALTHSVRAIDMSLLVQNLT